MTNQIELNKDYSKKINEELNDYLSNVQIAYMNTRGYHWNIVGELFFELHLKFEEIYTQLNTMADEIAERILMLGGTPIHSYSQYIKRATITEKLNVSDSKSTIAEVLNEQKTLLLQERNMIKLASENGDDGTINMLNTYIDYQEKLIWMLNAFAK